ncbi:MAG: hypothetical protein LBG58_02290 [Planctomycetaceae bacterium]|jgi:hypothetical protein|nr:hypothetical protein [Planctomycetaceae bacterium]
MEYQDQKTIKELLVCWITAAVVFFCALVPVPGLCDCDNCPHVNSTHSEKILKNCRVPDCCRLIGKTTANSDNGHNHYCSCNCANPPSATVSASNGFIVSDELKMLVLNAFFTPTETVIKPVLVINTQQLPIFWLPVRLHLFLFVLLN